jgi:uncharacterized protein (DUF2141 family)
MWHIKNKTIAIFAIATILFSFIEPKEAVYSLTVTVNNLRNENGLVQFALYNKNGSIPDENYSNYCKMLKGEIVNHSSKITFENIPKGKYAVNVLHDENRNGKIEKGFILPIEGIGFSNFETIGFTKRPNFLKASFDVNENKYVNVKMIYF